MADAAQARRGGASVSVHAIGQRPHKCTNVTAETNFKRGIFEMDKLRILPKESLLARTNNTKFCTARCPSVATPCTEEAPYTQQLSTPIHPREGGKNEHGNISATDQKTSNNVMREKKKIKKWSCNAH